MVVIQRQSSAQLPTQHRSYLEYYQRQAGGGTGLPKFRGAATQYGFGLGGLLRNLIRFIIPVGKQAV